MPRRCGARPQGYALFKGGGFVTVAAGIFFICHSYATLPPSDGPKTDTVEGENQRDQQE